MRGSIWMKGLMGSVLVVVIDYLIVSVCCHKLFLVLYRLVDILGSLCISVENIWHIKIK